MAATDAERLALYQQAEEEILTRGQSIAVNGRQMTRANLADVQNMIKVLQARVNSAARGPIVLGRPEGV